MRRWRRLSAKRLGQRSLYLRVDRAPPQAARGIERSVGAYNAGSPTEAVLLHGHDPGTAATRRLDWQAWTRVPLVNGWKQPTVRLDRGRDLYTRPMNGTDWLASNLVSM